MSRFDRTAAVLSLALLAVSVTPVARQLLAELRASRRRPTAPAIVDHPLLRQYMRQVMDDLR